MPSYRKGELDTLCSRNFSVIVVADRSLSAGGEGQKKANTEEEATRGGWQGLCTGGVGGGGVRSCCHMVGIACVK